VNYVCEGKQTVEVLKDIKPLAEKAAEVAAELARGGKPTGDPSHTTPGYVPVAAVPVHLITADNAKHLIVDSGFQPASAVPACK
jgi:ABC-type xylose transport system substrate-binding protein